jgi:hypothetical protein
VQERRHRRLEAVRHLRAAVAVAQPRADQPRLGVRPGVVEQPAQGERRHDRVVVEEEQVAAAGAAGGLVVGAGEAAVVGVAQQPHLGELLLDHVGGAVGRGVVHDDGLQADALRLVVQRRQAGAEQVAAVPVGDAHRHVDGPVAEELPPPRLYG